MKRDRRKFRLCRKISGYLQNQIVKELQEKERSLTEPILEKVISVIKEVGKENGYDYVLDSSKNQGVILADGDDLMEKVKIKLGF